MPTDRDGDGYLVAVTRLVPGLAVDLYGSAAAIDSARTRLARNKAESVSPELRDALRIEAGVPRFGTDMDARVLAPETGQQSRAIHYRKGCYIGQEIVARIDARGHTNRTLVGFLLPKGAAVPGADTPVMAEDNTVGRVTSAAISPQLNRPVALGYLRHELIVPGTAVQIGGETATVAALPFVDAKEQAS